MYCHICSKEKGKNIFVLDWEGMQYRVCPDCIDEYLEYYKQTVRLIEEFKKKAKDGTWEP